MIEPIFPDLINISSAVRLDGISISYSEIDLPAHFIKCAGRSISEYDMDIPSSLTAEEILIRSGNIGSIKIAQKVGLENFKDFLENLDLLNKIQFDIEEVGNPIPFKWGKCKLATSAYGLSLIHI